MALTGRAVRIGEPTDVAEARRVAAASASYVGLSEEDIDRLKIVVTEAATNLLKHAVGGGELVLQPRHEGEPPCLEVLALDTGPGLADMADVFSDGYSTTGSMGTGLGAIRRLADDMAVLSSSDAGTVLLARIVAHRSPAPAADSAFLLGVVSVPVAGEQVNGDSWARRVGPHGQALLVCDGLGHGQGAAEASALALETFARCDGLSPGDTLLELHRRMTSTRGAAAAVAFLDPEANLVRFAGAGNISASIHTPEATRNLVSLNGTVGHAVRGVQEFSYEWPPQSLLVVSTDGLRSRLDLSRYAGLFTRDPSLIAGAIYRDHTRRRDDATVLVLQRP